MKVLSKNITVALIGNPNTGKTTVFNALCGTRQRTGNYPGVTVEKRLGYFPVDDINVEIYDLPGLYSLHVTSIDERIAFDVLTGKRLEEKKKPDLVFYIIDASNLKRNLYLLFQILELRIPVVGILTMMDVAQKKGMKIDYTLLGERLKIPILAINAKDGNDIQKLKTELPGAIKKALENAGENYLDLYPGNFKKYYEFSLSKLQEVFGKTGTAYKPTYLDVSLAYTAQEEYLQYMKEYLLYEEALSHQEIQVTLDELKKEIQVIKEKAKEYFFYAPSQFVQMRYRAIDNVLRDIITIEQLEKKTATEFLDQIFTHKFWGLILFLNIMAVMFQSIYTWAEPIMEFLDEGVGALSDLVRQSGIFPPLLESFLVDGVIAGIGSVVVFVPQIAILFLFIAILEDTGYLARASFLMDKLLSWTGLNGRSFIPLISSFACAVPGIMSTRVINDDKVRISTILVAPLMSCSARLPVYVLFIGVFIEPVYGPLFAGLTLFLMYSIGPVFALIISYILNHKILKTPSLPFVMELPEYHFPSLRNVFFRVYDAVKAFLLRAGKVIFTVSVVIWALIYFPRDEEKAMQAHADLIAEIETLKSRLEAEPDNSELTAKIQELEEELGNKIEAFHLANSYLGRLGKFLEPVFRPLGFDWKLSIGVISSFPAREVIVATLGIIYSVGEADEESVDLRSKLLEEKKPDGTPLYTPLTAISIMVFYALCLQCVSTLAVIKKETGRWKYPVIAFLYQTLLAYFVALLVYQIGKLFL